MNLTLILTFDRDATLGRGDGVVGLVDAEIEHDPATGLPFLGGRALKGLLVEECANLLFALELQSAPGLPNLKNAAGFLFGQAGSTLESDAKMQIGRAQMPADLRQAVEEAVANRQIQPEKVLDLHTAIRRQTASDDSTGAPAENSLRSIRVLLHGSELEARLSLPDDTDHSALGLLAACVMSLRRAGATRNRGRGRLSGRLYNAAGQDITGDSYKLFVKDAKGEIK